MLGKHDFDCAVRLVFFIVFTKINHKILHPLGTGSHFGGCPLVTTESQSFSFPTYAPLRIEEHGCSWYDNRCPPLTPFFIRFNNPLDTSVFSEDLLRIEPKITGLTVNAYGNVIQIDHGNGYSTVYAHLSNIGVGVCQSVSKGQWIGAAGNTGNSQGAHLHFEVRQNGGFINPWFVLP